MTREYAAGDGDAIELAIQGVECPIPLGTLVLCGADRAREYPSMSLGAIVSKYYEVIDGRIHGVATAIGNVCIGFAMRPLEESLPPGKQRATLRVLSQGAGFRLPVEVDRRLTVEWDALSKAPELVGRWHWRYGDPIWKLTSEEFIRELVQRYLRQFPRSDFRLALDLVELEDLAAEGNRRA